MRIENEYKAIAGVDLLQGDFVHIKDGVCWKVSNHKQVVYSVIGCPLKGQVARLCGEDTILIIDD